MAKRKAEKNLYAPERVSTTIDCGLFDELSEYAHQRNMDMEQLNRKALQFFHMVCVGDYEANEALKRIDIEMTAQRFLESLPAVGETTITLIH